MRRTDYCDIRYNRFPQPHSAAEQVPYTLTIRFYYEEIW